MFVRWADMLLLSAPQAVKPRSWRLCLDVGRRTPSFCLIYLPPSPTSQSVARDWAFALWGCIRPGAVDGWWLVSIPITALAARMFRAGLPTVFSLSSSHLPCV
jgi:hypothetical protein